MAKSKKVQYFICPNCIQPSLLDGKCKRCGYVTTVEAAKKVLKKTRKKSQ